MSSASKTVHIKFLSKLGTYTPLIQSPSGDLYQEYQQVGDQVVTYPDFSKTKPELYFICTSSRAVEGAVTPVSMRYYFNDSEITLLPAEFLTGCLPECLKSSALVRTSHTSVSES